MQLRNRYVPSIYDRKTNFERKSSYNKKPTSERKAGYNLKSTYHVKPTYQDTNKNEKSLDITFKNLRSKDNNYKKQLLFIEEQQNQILEKINDLKKRI